MTIEPEIELRISRDHDAPAFNTPFVLGTSSGKAFLFATSGCSEPPFEFRSEGEFTRSSMLTRRYMHVQNLFLNSKQENKRRFVP